MFVGKLVENTLRSIAAIVMLFGDLSLLVESSTFDVFSADAILAVLVSLTAVFIAYHIRYGWFTVPEDFHDHGRLLEEEVARPFPLVKEIFSSEQLKIKDSRLAPPKEKVCPSCTNVLEDSAKSSTIKLTSEDDKTFQSPINIDDALVMPVFWSPLLWVNFTNIPDHMFLINTGFVAELDCIWDNQQDVPYLCGGPLGGDYIFSGIIFHWGQKDKSGSEHTINNQKFPMEAQLVYYNKECKTLDAAVRKQGTDGLAIISLLFQLSYIDNIALDPLIDYLNSIVETGSKQKIKPFPLSWLHAPFDKHYYSYFGSLTLPPYTEMVTWIVYSRQVPISWRQLLEFRKLRSTSGIITQNSRPVQPSNGRPIYHWK